MTIENKSASFFISFFLKSYSSTCRKVHRRKKKKKLDTNCLLLLVGGTSKLHLNAVRAIQRTLGG